jgi:serine/threonine-protein kinase
MAMFLNEARLAARLNHGNVVQTYEVGVEDGHHFLAMDFLDGQPLNAILRKAGRDAVPLDVHLRVLADMLAGLSYAHTLKDFDGTELHVVHRDVSPQNVFVTYDGHVKVVDFGIAKATGVASNTQSGVFKGKLAYVAPEQAGGDVVDARADIFSVGVMLWEAMACRRMAKGDSQTALLGRRLAGAEQRILEVVPDADPELAAICDRAMAHRPDDRYQSAEDFRVALEDYLARFSRRVGPREVGQFVSQLFAAERERIRLVIDEQMKRLMRETATEIPMPTIDMYAGTRDLTPITSTDTGAETRVEGTTRPGADDTGTGNVPRSQGTLAAAAFVHPAAGRGMGRPLIVGLGVLAATLAVGLGVLLATRNTAPPPVAAAPPAEPQMIKLAIAFGPPGAVAKLDGVPLAESPFVAQVRRDGSMHRVDVEAPGRKPETRMVSYEKDVSITVSLAAPEAATEASSSTASSHPPAPGADASKRVPPAGPARPRPEKPGLGIDEKDPYKQ